MYVTFSLLWYDYFSRKCGKWKRGINLTLIRIVMFDSLKQYCQNKSKSVFIYQATDSSDILIHILAKCY